MTTLATAYVNIQASAQGQGKKLIKDFGGQADTAADKAGKSSGKKFGGAFTGIVKKAGAIGAAVAVGLAAKGGIDRALNIENAQAKLKGLGNDTQTVSKIMDNALASVSGTSFGLGEAATTAAGAVAAGIEPGQALERMLKSVANSAASAGVGMDEMGAIYNKVATSNKAQGDVLAQVNEKGIPLTATLAKQLGKTGAEVEKMASKGQIGFKEFEAAMTQASGTVAEETGKTFTGSMSNLSAAGSRIGATVMTPFLNIARVGANALIPVLDGINKAIAPVMASFGEWAQQNMPGVFSAMGDGLSKIGDVLGPIASQIGAAIGPAFAQLAAQIGPVISQIGTALGPVFAQISAAIGPLIPQIIEFATSFSPVSILMQALLPVLPQIVGMLGTLAGAFGQIVAAVLPLATTLMTAIVPVFTQLVATVLPVVIQLVTTLVSAFAPLIAQLVATLAPILTQLATTLFPMVSSALTAIIGAVLPVVNVILAVLMPVIQSLLPVITSVFSAAATIVTGVMQVIQGVIQVVTGIISGNWSQVWDGIKNVFQGIWTAIGGILSAAWSLITGILSVGLAAISGLWNGIWTGIQQTFSGVWEGIKSFGQGAMDSISGFISGGLDTISSTWNRVWDSIKSFVSETLGNIKRSVSEGIGNVVTFFTELPGKAVAALGGFAGKMLTVGQQVIQGMIDGISGMVSNVIESISGVVNGAIDGAKRLLGIHSPSRVFRDEVGKQISRGLAAGVTADQGKAVKAVEDLSKAVAKAGEKAIKQETANAKADRTKANAQIAKHNKALAAKRDAAVAKADKIKNSKQRAAAKKAAQSAFKAAKKDRLPALSKAEAEKVAKRNIRAIQSAQGKAQRILDAQGQTTGGIWEFGNTKGVQRIVNSLSDSGKWTRNATRQTRSSTLADLAKGREVMADRIESANKRLDEMVDYRNQNADRIMGELDLKPVEDKDGKKKKLSIADVSSRVKSLAAKARKFASRLAALGKAGIPAGLIQEIAGYGTTEGIQVADAILSGTKKQQSDLGKDWKGLESASSRFGSVAAEQFFGVGVAAQQGIIKGLQSDDQKLKKAAENLASKLTKATRKALGIHSPSRVFRDQVGAYIPAGVIAGIDQGQSKLDHRVAGMVGTQAPNIAQIAPAEFTGGAYGADQPIIIQGPLVEVKEMRVDSERRVKQVAQDLHTRATRAARSRGAVQLAGVVR